MALGQIIVTNVSDSSCGCCTRTDMSAAVVSCNGCIAMQVAAGCSSVQVWGMISQVAGWNGSTLMVSVELFWLEIINGYIYIYTHLP